MQLRDAAEADAEAINAIYNHYVLTSTSTLQLEPSTLEERRAWIREHGGEYPVIVAEDGGELIAWGSLSRYAERRGYRFTVENSVYVRHDRHGRGAGSALLAELIARARTAGMHSIIAKVSNEQVASIRLHERHGFVQVAHLREVGFKFDAWRDVLFLQRML